MNYSIEELKSTWDFYNDKAEEIIKSVFEITTKFINSDMLKKYREYNEKNNFVENYPFNIFELISDIYYRENFHSDIIAKLFEHEIILKNFLNYIEVDSNKYINSQIKREEKKIDILIKTETNCIIIENKLNWASDMREQLSRYYEICKNDKLEVDKIVYLSPNSSKQPEEHSIEGIPNHKELVKIIIGYDGENEDFYTMVLKKSLKEMYNNEPKEWLLLLEHYLKILRKTGVTKMDKLTEKLYDKILSEPQEYEKIKLIVDMYNNLKIPRMNNLVSKLNGKNLNNVGYVREFPSEKRGAKYAIFIFVDKFEYTSLYFFQHDTNKPQQDKDNKDIETWLKKHNLFEGFFLDVYWYNRWCKKFEFPKEEKFLYEFTEKLIKCLEEDIESIYSGK